MRNAILKIASKVFYALAGFLDRLAGLAYVCHRWCIIRTNDYPF